jgi:hypothetical protein
MSERWFAAELNPAAKASCCFGKGHAQTAEELYRKPHQDRREQAKLWGARRREPRPVTRDQRRAGASPTSSPQIYNTGSPKASTHPISKRQRLCSTNSRKALGLARCRLA